jgi:undecaprenyl-diphosphatase
LVGLIVGWSDCLCFGLLILFDDMNFLQSIILAIIEGITEYLPISSTGHMIIASSVMGIASDDFTKLFTVCVQLGAILAVVVLYWRRFFKSLDFYWKLGVAFIPSAVVGVLLSDVIDKALENPIGVAVALLLGGVVLLGVDRWFRRPAIYSDGEVSYARAFRIGLFQTFALLPGVSRSGATIVGGMAQGLARTAAAEFSFFLAVPTMFAATSKKLFDYWEQGLELSREQVGYLAIGNVVAFVVAALAIRGFVGFLTRRGFFVFGIYRIVVGVVLLLLYAAGVLHVSPDGGM